MNVDIQHEVFHRILDDLRGRHYCLFERYVLRGFICFCATGTPLLLGCGCILGRHRIVAVAIFLACLFGQLSGAVEELFLVDLGSWFKHGCARYSDVECSKCRLCEPGTEAQSKYIFLLFTVQQNGCCW